MTGHDADAGPRRRSVLGALGTGATTAVAGCGYRPRIGDVRWRAKVGGFVAYAVDAGVLEVYQPPDLYPGSSPLAPSHDAADVTGDHGSKTKTVVVARDPTDGRVGGVRELGGMSYDMVPGRARVYFGNVTGKAPPATEHELVGVAPAVGTNASGSFDVVRSTAFDGELWHVERDPAGTVAVVTLEDTVYRLTANLDVLSTHSMPEPDHVYAPPALASGTAGAFLVLDDPSMLRGFPADGGSWERDVVGVAEASLAVVEDTVFLAAPDVSAFDAATGESVGLSEQVRDAGRLFTDGDRAYAASRGDVYAFAPDGSVARSRGIADAFRGVDRGPVLAGNDLVVVGTADRTVALDRADGSVRWRRSFPEPAFVGATDRALVLRDGREHVGRSYTDGGA